MSSGTNPTINSAEVNAFLRTLPEEIFSLAKAYFQEAAMSADAKIKENATSKLKVRTGNLRKSIRFEVSGTTLATIKASIYAAGAIGANTIVYAPIHEYGGTIKAKNAYKGVPGGPYLNIPADENKTPAGVTRKQAREVFNMGGYRVGKVVYLNGVAMFYLVKQVTIKPRLGMVKAVEDEIPTLLDKLRSGLDLI